MLLNMAGTITSITFLTIIVMLTTFSLAFTIDPLMTTTNAATTAHDMPSHQNYNHRGLISEQRRKLLLESELIVVFNRRRLPSEQRRKLVLELELIEDAGSLDSQEWDDWIKIYKILHRERELHGNTVTESYALRFTTDSLTTTPCPEGSSEITAGSEDSSPRPEVSSLRPKVSSLSPEDSSLRPEVSSLRPEVSSPENSLTITAYVRYICILLFLICIIIFGIFICLWLQLETKPETRKTIDL